MSSSPPLHVARSDAVAERLLRLRRRREALFGADLFADPAWDILLDLLAAEAAGSEVAEAGLCRAAAVPPTTTRRWIDLLVERDLIVRQPHPTDGATIFLHLHPDTLAKLDRLLRDF